MGTFICNREGFDTSMFICVNMNVPLLFPPVVCIQCSHSLSHVGSYFKKPSTYIRYC
ncbi:hypothetical protein RchiOBHm_Chr1g0345731 [Rosa chinensis]|uniref:Uncharacterized protein n=1 Tax=Rosa chinensis TaxID=74649 RepID=A0A2P6SEW1_ROSCH|nr:hypothetical protein RchiOBHm_Chr1g0345731 [Rosa chinensis]